MTVSLRLDEKRCLRAAAIPGRLRRTREGRVILTVDAPGSGGRTATTHLRAERYVRALLALGLIVAPAGAGDYRPSEEGERVIAELALAAGAGVTVR